MSRHLAWAWFPELQRVAATSDSWGLWHAAYRPVLRSPRYYGIAIATQVLAQLIVVLPVSQLARRLGFYGHFLEFGLPVIVAVIGCFVIIWLVRRGITRNLRLELTKRGLPTCLACGYDLTGNVSGVCPECGTNSARKTPVDYHAE